MSGKSFYTIIAAKLADLGNNIINCLSLSHELILHLAIDSARCSLSGPEHERGANEYAISQAALTG